MVDEKIARHEFIGPEHNPDRLGQFRILVELNEYPHVVPLVIGKNGDWFLKTIYPSRIENMNDAFKLDKEEQWYEDHADEFEPASPELREQLIQAAETTRNKTERMNIRMKKADMDKLKRIAQREGIPYQSLVTSIIHKYIEGSFVDIQEAKKFSSSNYDKPPVIGPQLPYFVFSVFLQYSLRNWRKKDTLKQ